MDFRSRKEFDYVAATRNFTEQMRKDEETRLKWFQKYQWLCDEYKNVQQELQELCRKKQTFSEKDARSCLPFPRTTNATYGWLSLKPEFRLEKYGTFVVKYPNPMDEIIFLSGDIPKIAAGKGFF